MAEDTVRETEERYFAALLAGDLDTLEELLAPDFTLVDVLAGQVVPRAAMLGLLAEGRLRFVEIDRDPDAALVREHPGVGAVIGETRMVMLADGHQVATHSRYTHVFIDTDRGWRLFSAQGTQISAPPG